MIPMVADFEKPEVGLSPLWCHSLIDLGTQAGSFAGVPKHSRKLAIGWELPTQLSKRAPNVSQPLLLRSTLTASMGDNAGLRKLITGWRGAVFADTREANTWVDESLHKCVGRSGIGILELSKTGEHVNVASISKAPNPITFPKMKSPAVFFSLLPLLWTTQTADDLDEFSEGKKAAINDIIRVYGPMKAVYDRLPPKVKEKIALSPEWKQLQSGSSATSQPDVEDHFGEHDEVF